MAKKEQEQTTDMIRVVAETKDIKSLIYVVRGQQVMLDDVKVTGTYVFQLPLQGKTFLSSFFIRFFKSHYDFLSFFVRVSTLSRNILFSSSRRSTSDLSSFTVVGI